jgi:hypothetical protein
MSDDDTSSGNEIEEVSTPKTKSQKKRGPGRPKKFTPKNSKNTSGLRTEPENKENMIEMCYAGVTNFKKIASFFKNLNADKIHFEFLPTGLNLYTKNFKEQNDARISFRGEEMASYYCQEPFSIDVNFANLEPIFSKLDKIYVMSRIFVETASKHKKIIIVLENEYNIDECFDVEIFMDGKSQQTNYSEPFLQNMDEQLSFKLPGKYFKKMISDSKQMDKQWTIDMHGPTGPLLFSYKTENGQVAAKIVPKQSKIADFEIKSSLEPREILSVSVFLDNIKSVSNSSLGDDIYIKASKGKPLRTFARLDGTAVVVDVIVATVNFKGL